eukprot:TRINITY_DN9124_c0_g2_i2.p1 TRINITY_DN9124_c0_g2~~TRINITY_DN9124_c0_g2_i2.p1  ORF type:complete len:718 (+),score=204.97 TRINITY_DN9124_c0_g2_i2:50-2155(+)
MPHLIPQNRHPPSRQDLRSVGVDVGCERTRAFVSDGPAARQISVFPTLLGFTRRVLIGRDARSECDTRHTNLLRHLPAYLARHLAVRLTHTRDGASRVRDVPLELGLALHLARVRESLGWVAGVPHKWTFSVPAVFTHRERERLLRAALAAGADAGSVELVPSTVCIAAHYAKQVLRRDLLAPRERVLLVGDVGSRFTSVSVVRFRLGTSSRDSQPSVSIEVLRTGGLRQGSFAVDMAMAGKLQQEASADVPFGAVLAAAEQSKKDLACLRESSVQARNCSFVVTKADLAEVAQPFVTQVKKLLVQVAAGTPAPEMALMVGGGSRMPAILDLVRAKDGLGLGLDVMDTDFSTAMGAAALAADCGITTPCCPPAAHDLWAVAAPPSSEPPRRLFSGGQGAEQLGASPSPAGWVLLQLPAGAARPSPADVAPRDALIEAPPPHGVLPSDDAAETAAASAVGAVRPGVMLLCGPAGAPKIVGEVEHTPRLPAVAGLRQALVAEQAAAQRIELMDERRNELEEALLRLDDDDDGDAERLADAALAGLRPYVELARRWAVDTDPEPPYNTATVAALTDLLKEVPVRAAAAAPETERQLRALMEAVARLRRPRCGAGGGRAGTPSPVKRRPAGRAKFAAPASARPKPGRSACIRSASLYAQPSWPRPAAEVSGLQDVRRVRRAGPNDTAGTPERERTRKVAPVHRLM